MSTSSRTDALAARRAEILAAEPRLRARDLAQRLDISEAELVALGHDDVDVTPLRAEWAAIIATVPALGRVMALTRNEHVVHERKGIYGTLEGNAHVGLIVGEDIDLRIFFSHWKSGFALTERIESGFRRSLQFFDAQGTAIHKIWLTGDSSIEAFDLLVAKFSAPVAPLAIEPPAASKPGLADTEIDVEGFRAAWDALKDTHQFHGLLNKFKLERLQALRLAGETRARRVPVSALRAALETSASRKLPIMVFVGNPGMIQIHTGPVENLKAAGPWFNVMDEAFNLHLNEAALDSAWVVWKPTEDGTVTSLELFDAGGLLAATLFGKRKPGMAEDEGWRAVVSGLTEREAA
ncbi:hemin-degrading factor [Parvibaculum sp.]|uniref:hemin-degrading factor n=1 Tax=Parvibaculum sp. TaxID=2024848 RepID=UPI0034A05E2A